MDAVTVIRHDDGQVVVVSSGIDGGALPIVTLLHDGIARVAEHEFGKRVEVE